MYLPILILIHLCYIILCVYQYNIKLTVLSPRRRFPVYAPRVVKSILAAGSVQLIFQTVLSIIFIYYPLPTNQIALTDLLLIGLIVWVLLNVFDYINKYYIDSIR